MKTADYIITRASFNEINTFIQEVEIFEVNDKDCISSSEKISRERLITLLRNGKKIYTGGYNDQNEYYRSNWVNLYSNFSSFTISINGYYTTYDSLGSLPKVIPCRKTFISYYHKDDEIYKNKLQSLTKDILTHKSVEKGDIDTDVSTEYIKHLIQDGYLADTSVLTVLIGPKTKCRKHVDWEISGALNFKVGDKYSGLLGLLLPTHPDYGKPNFYYDNIPARLADNHKTNYAIIESWTSDRVQIQNLIEMAFENRNTKIDKRDNGRAQMGKNTCE